MAVEMAESNVWFDKWRYDEAEKVYHESANKCLDECNCEVENEIIEPSAVSEEPSKKAEDAGLGPSLASQIAKARQEIQNISISCSSNKGGKGSDGVVNSDLLNRITKLEIVNNKLTTTVSTLEQTIIDLTKRLSSLECSRTTTAPAAKPAAKQVEEEEDDDDDVDLFGSDDEEEDAEAARVREERLKAYAEKKSKKPGPIAKSSVLLACKPWDDETDMKVMETEIRKIEMDGLTWGASKLVPLAYGIMKLTLLCIVEDEKVSIDDLTEKICEMEDYVQSVDIDAFNKI